VRDAGGRALPDARARARGQPAAAAHHPARCAPPRGQGASCRGPLHAGERAGSTCWHASRVAAVVLCPGVGSVAVALMWPHCAPCHAGGTSSYAHTSALHCPHVASQSASHALRRRVRCSERRRGAAPGRRLQERPHRYLDRSSDPGQCGGLAAVPELRLPAPQREDSESSSATGDSPTSTIQLIIKRDS